MQKTIPYKPDHFYFLGSTVNQVIGFRAARGTGPCEVMETKNEGYYLEYAPSSHLAFQLSLNTMGWLTVTNAWCTKSPKLSTFLL